MKRLVSLAVSAVILGVIYWRIDFGGFLEAFRRSDILWMALSLSLVVPLTALTAARLRQLMPPGRPFSLGESLRLILVASAFNMVLPSKMGDLLKAWFLRQRGHVRGTLALSLVVFEKACDMLSLFVWCAFGLLLHPHGGPFFDAMAVVVAVGLVAGALLLGSRTAAAVVLRAAARIAPSKLGPKIDDLRAAWGEMHGYFWSDRRRAARVVATSLFIWLGHLLQIWAFLFALRAPVPLVAHLGLAPLAILAGLVPLTFAGIGTRDAALIALYAPWVDAPTAAALGLLCTLRYLMPALGGLPFVGRYLAPARAMREDPVETLLRADLATPPEASR